jgi:hypothetical protein
VLALQRTAGNRAIARYVPNLEADAIGPAPAHDVIRDSRDPRARMLPSGTELPGIVVCYGAAIEPLIDTEHHWIEIGDESYGWWPSGDIDASGAAFGGVPGVLNGTTLPRSRGTATRDPHHGDPARRYAVVTTWGGYPASAAEAARQAADQIRTFARGYSDDYAWTPAGTDCHEFVTDALAAAGLAPSSRRL